MKLRFPLLLAILLIGLVSGAQAAHIAGAELTYSCLSPNNYRVRLKMYRDCAGTGAPFDDPLLLYVFRSSDGSVYDTYEIPVPLNTPQVLPVNWNACVGTTYNICLEEGEYTFPLTLPGRVDGYDIAWTRCCRNAAITNLVDPGCQGVTFLAHVPGTNEASGCNSMPTFNNTPSIFLCAGQIYNFDYSATDVDGDSLVYRLSTPFGSTNFQGLGTGGATNGTCNSPLQPSLSATNPMGPPPYTGVIFSGGSSAQNPFGPGGFATINSSTGYFQALPANIGVYVVAISVLEYRNGVLLSENKRDFQFRVVACLQQGPPPVLTHDLTGLNVVNDTIIVEAGQSFCYTFDVTDSQAPSSIAVTPLSVSFGGNGGFPPPYATITTSGTTPPVTGSICWSPACEYVGDLVPMIISARDVNDCPNYNIVFDTVWVKILPPVIAPPVVNANLSNLPVVNDTIVLAVQDSFCFQFTVIDTLGTGNLTAQCLLQDTLGNMLGQVHSVSTTVVGDTLFGEVCWQTYCNYDRVYMFVINGMDDNQCPPGNINRDTVYLRVLPPYNPPPVITTDISFNPTIGDTILANVNDEFCFNFEVLDTSLLAGNGVNFNVLIYSQSGIPIINNPVNYSVFGNNDSINGEICWTPNCDNVDELITMIVLGDQQNACQLHNFDRDTIYIRVNEPFKPLPIISHDLGPNFPGNTEISVADDEDFCYTFQLVDTFVPAKVIYTIDVFDANGVQFTGNGPVLTYTTQVDSLLEGTICWTVPCDLSDQRFLIVMTGRDSFDCRASNTVYDSVFIRHTDNPPSMLRFCNASVNPDDASITIDWEASLETDVQSVVIYRKRDDEIVFQAIDTLVNLSQITYVDQNAVDADLHSYCYQIQAIDRCANNSILSDEICTVLLNAVPNGYTSELSWTPFIGWNGGFSSYDIFHSAPISNGFGSTLLTQIQPSTTSFVHGDVPKARICYRIATISDGSGCADRSWSNEVCLDFPPTLFVPNAFTPNGDDLNDYFSSFGEFVESFQLDIYDRWGKLLFSSQSIQNGWDGTVNGTAAPEGTYIFKIEVRGYDGQVLKRNGSLTLIR